MRANAITVDGVPPWLDAVPDAGQPAHDGPTTPETADNAGRTVWEKLLSGIGEVTSRLVRIERGHSTSLTLAETCERLGCSERKVYYLLKQRKLRRAQRHGRKIMILSESVEALIFPAEVKRAAARATRQQPPTARVSAPAVDWRPLTRAGVREAMERTGANSPPFPPDSKPRR